MRYKVGMYGGCFDPLHNGHIHNIIRAASLCEELYVIISWGEGRESTPKEIRYRWILNSCKHLPNVKILLLEDAAASKDAYNNGDYWRKGAEDIKRMIGKHIDIVFCGSDYLGTNRFEGLYSESTIYYFDRREVPISSTDIRNEPLKYWDYIPNICKPYYAKRVLVIGGESTGKSTLVQNLAIAYNTNFVAEVGRDTCEYAGGEEYMNKEDMLENLLRQRVNVMDALKNTNRVLFVDTDALTTLFYSHFLLGDDAEAMGQCTNLAEAINAISDWDLVLFLEPDVEFIQDGTRNEEIKANRTKYSERIKTLFTNRNIKCHYISGDYLNRFNEAKRLINTEFRFTTQN